MHLQPETLLQDGKYKIEKTLGQGGFGITYLAEQSMLDRQVAIKEFFFKEFCERDTTTSHVTLGTQSNRETVERFRKKFIKEAKTISKFQHPNIIQIHDVFEENGTAYYVMEYIEGESLGDMVRRRGALPEAEATGYIRKVADALGYIHRRNVNHLDIKPGNIMLRQEDHQIVLIDFGVSKQYDEQTMEGTTTTPVGISHGYSPSEQYKKNGVNSFSPQSDIYALGATFYKLLTGKTPPEAIDVAQDGLPPLPAHISAAAQAVIRKSMQLLKKDRPQNVEEFLAILSGEKPVPVPPAGEVTEVTLVEKPSEPKPEPKPRVTNPKTPKEKETTPKTPIESLPKRNNKTLWAGLSAAAVVLAAVLFFVLKGGDEPQPIEEVVGKVTSNIVTRQPIYSSDGTILFYWTGAMQDNHPEGEGVATYPEDDKDGRKEYRGTYINGIRQASEAELTYTNGNSYKGSFQGNHFLKGRLTLATDGLYFEGTFKDDQPYNGKWCWLSDGSVYSVVTNGNEKER